MRLTRIRAGVHRTGLGPKEHPAPERTLLPSVRGCALGVALAALVAGCSSPRPSPPICGEGAEGPLFGPVSDPEEYLLEMLSREAADPLWADPFHCEVLAKKFVSLAARRRTEGRAVTPALFHAGASYERCHMWDEAMARYRALLNEDASHVRARLRLAILEHATGGALDPAIARVRGIVEDTHEEDPDALVQLAVLLMERRGAGEGDDCGTDLDCAARHLERALEVDDRFVPAFNQLALYYLELGREGKRPPSTLVERTEYTKQVSSDAAGLALRPVTTGLALDANNAALHHTRAMILLAQGEVREALAALRTATRLEPRFFAAWASYALALAAARDFKGAADAYERALEIRPDDYETLVGLAYARRAALVPADVGSVRVVMIHNLLSRAVQLAPERPEAHFNLALLDDSFASPDDPGAAAAVRKHLEAFLERAGSDESMAHAVRAARARLAALAPDVDPADATTRSEGE